MKNVWARLPRWETLSTLITIAVSAWMAFGLKPALHAEDSRVVVLQMRADQIDAHLTATDTTVQRIGMQLEAEENELSHLQGELAGAFAIVTLLTAGNFAVQLGRNRRVDRP